MTVFWIAAAFLITGVLLLLLAPLLQRAAPAGSRVPRRAAMIAVYRDQRRELDADLNEGALSQARYGEAREEIERQLLQDMEGDDVATERLGEKRRHAAFVTGLLLPIAAVALYLHVGTPQALAPAARLAEPPPHALDTRQVEAMVGRLALRMQQNPDDAEGWVMLARSYTSLRRYDEAARAYANAVSRLPPNGQLLADYADLLAMAQGRRLQGEPEKIIALALAADPRNLKALALAGTVALEKHEYSVALEHWGNILELVPPDSDIARSVRGSIAQTQALAGGAPANPAPRP